MNVKESIVTIGGGSQILCGVEWLVIQLIVLPIDKIVGLHLRVSVPHELEVDLVVHSGLGLRVERRHDTAAAMKLIITRRGCQEAHRCR